MLGADPAEPTVFEAYSVASEFGVGYRTLLTHLVYSAGVLARDRADVLARHTAKRIRGAIAPEPPRARADRDLRGRAEAGRTT